MKRGMPVSSFIAFGGFLEDRKKTLETLVELAIEGDDEECWDSKRAGLLLRTQSSPAEFRELGIAEELIRFVWPEGE